MTNFKSLEDILDMDFSNLRGQNGRATDKAIGSLVIKLNEFFEQFGNTKPSDDVLEKFQELMQEIINRVNISEYSYFKQRYAQDFQGSSQDDIDKLARGVYIKDFSQIAPRIKHWAATERGGEELRNNIELQKAIKHLQTWASYVTS